MTISFGWSSLLKTVICIIGFGKFQKIERFRQFAVTLFLFVHSCALIHFTTAIYTYIKFVCCCLFVRLIFFSMAPIRFGLDCRSRMKRSFLVLSVWVCVCCAFIHTCIHARALIIWRNANTRVSFIRKRSFDYRQLHCHRANYDDTVAQSGFDN